MGSRRHPQPSPEEDRTIDLDLSLATRRNAVSRYSSRSTEQTMAPPPPPPAASDNTLHRLGHLDIHADDAAGSPGAAADKKKKRVVRRAVEDDSKSERGLRQIAIKVSEKVESKGRTTYIEVADEIAAELANSSNNVSSPDQPQLDDKNIRRRVYDALNVLMAADIISKDKRQIIWKGLPPDSLKDIEELKKERLELRSRIEKKAAYLQELEEQHAGLQNLIQRNEQLYPSGNAPGGSVSLPFILVQTSPHATVDVETSEDTRLVHFDFNNTPFQLHDDNYVLKAMESHETPQNDNITQNVTDGGDGFGTSGLDDAQVPNAVSNLPDRPSSSPPLPGLLRARAKPDH